MALSGLGGGAGNVAGGNPAGTGTSLNYIGNFVYANSGPFSSSTSAQTMLNFTTGAEIIKGKITCFGQVKFTDPANGGMSTWELSYNSEVVSLQRLDTSAADMPSQGFIDLVIPPFTLVTLKVVSYENTADEELTAMFTGRVY